MVSACVLRPAVSADAAFLAWGLDEAADGLFTTLLGRRSGGVLTRLAAQPTHAFSFEHAVVAEVDGVATGFCQGFPSGTPGGTSELVRAAGLGALRLAAITTLARPLFAALDRHDEGEWYLQAIAVRPAARSTGVGRALFSDAVDRAARAGCRTLTLDVDVTNVRARSLYERLGLQVVATSPPVSLLDRASVHRMTRLLD